jgi:LacI family transcriptional regulator
MTDVAKAAGVSQSTVSMVLNNMPGARLADNTRATVLQVAAQMGYALPKRETPPPPASTPARKKVIGYLVDEISTSPHPVVSVDGARDAAWEHECLVTVAVTRNNPEQTDAAIEMMLSHPDLIGVIYSTIFTREVEVPARLRQQPLVLLNCHSPGSRLPTVVPGEIGGGQAATEHLITLGHERIAFINGESWQEAAEDRLKGYRRALATADLPFDPALVRAGDWMSGSGFEHTLSLMGEPRPPTAIFCANDLMAVGAIEALRQLGLRVPEDVSVMGYDDQEISRHTHPPLTTMVLPNYDMGRAAVELLFDLVDGTSQRRTMLKVDCPLVERDSVAERAQTA